jgi:exodeoxyribonuclease-1
VGGGLTLSAYFERIDALAESADEPGQALLEALYDYAEGIAPEAG